ncbi:MAG: MarC family protein [bacterium]
MFHKILLATVPLFVAMDALGVFPMFIAFTHQLEKEDKRKVLIDSLLTSYGLCLGFIFLGKALFHVLGISSGDFMVAGGAILFILAMNDLISQEKVRRRPMRRDVGIVPIGTPLIAGPAVLTTILILLENYGLPVVIISVSINIAFVGLTFGLSDWILRFIGESGAKVLSKMASLFLVAIAVMMVRKGIVNLLLLLRAG